MNFRLTEMTGCNGARSAGKRRFAMMTKQVSLSAVALLATSLGVGAAFAQSDQTPASKAPMHQGMDHRGMMDMSKMNRMMDNCNRMMESKQQRSPSEPRTTTPDKG
jgi:Spy/CpxP family protein refolding chaperone